MTTGTFFAIYIQKLVQPIFNHYLNVMEGLLKSTFLHQPSMFKIGFAFFIIDTNYPERSTFRSRV